MMPEPLIRVDEIGKKFCRDLKRSLRYGLTDLVSEAIGSRRQPSELRTGEFWALQDIGFELRRGESLGLIGPNGAGKTTLLRILNGLIRPDTGRIEVRGRMQALIALGAGFNPILTGRENVYINGAVLGIPKREIDKRFDEIVDFSGVEEFIDAPIQSYSSGMVVRLGFAVAIHMDPDILLVDEVLAVGDLSFRARCSQKLGELKNRGVPWILVSHDMGTIRNQTNRVMVLEHGRCSYIGAPDEAIAHYRVAASRPAHSSTACREQDLDDHVETREARITGVRLLNECGEECVAFQTGNSLKVEVSFETYAPIENAAFGIAFYSGDGDCLTGSNTAIDGVEIEKLASTGSACFEIEHIPFLPGIYRVRIDLHDRHMGVIDSRVDAAILRVDGGRFAAGLFATEHRWRVE
jgi:lipopolysaccharide transport system ATP-binding protein